MTDCEFIDDAQRYRWLRATTNHITSKGRRIELASPEELDAAIDRLIDADGVADTHTDHPLRHYDKTCPACNPSGVEDKTK